MSVDVTWIGCFCFLDGLQQFSFIYAAPQYFSIIRCSVHEIRKSLLRVHISNSSNLFSVLTFKVHDPHPYNKTEYTQPWTKWYLKFRLSDALHNSGRILLNTARACSMRILISTLRSRLEVIQYPKYLIFVQLQSLFQQCCSRVSDGL